MLPCNTCAYRESIPGNCHIRCTFDWGHRATPEQLNALFVKITVRNSQWFKFPFNFDPTWGPDECPHRADARVPENVAKSNPFAELISLLG